MSSKTRFDPQVSTPIVASHEVEEVPGERPAPSLEAPEAQGGSLWPGASLDVDPRALQLALEAFRSKRGGDPFSHVVGRTMASIAVEPGEPGSVHVRTVSSPTAEELEPNEVLLRVVYLGVCGTDDEIVAGEYGKGPAADDHLILGHEALCEVAAVGSAVEGFAVGDLVVPTVRRKGNSSLDEQGRADLTTDPDPPERGINARHGYATERVVEEAENLVSIPKQLGRLGVLLEPLSVVEKGLVEAINLQSVRLRPLDSDPTDLAGITPWLPERAAVLGAGPVGLLAALALRLRGVEVTVFDRAPSTDPKAKLAESLGATYVSTASESIDDYVARKHGDAAPYEMIFEAVGHSGFTFDSTEHLSKNGVLVLSGIPGGHGEHSIEAERFHRETVLGNRLVVGTVNAHRSHFQRGVEDLTAAEQRFPGWLSRLITTEVDGLEEAVRLYGTKSPGDIKRVVHVSPEIELMEPGEKPAAVEPKEKANSAVVRLDPRMDALVPNDAHVEQLARGFLWSEGPLWMPESGSLLLSDVPRNAIFQWSPEGGLKTFMEPSGYTGSKPRGGEPGSNGLTLDREGRLVMCEHGDRRVTRVEADGTKTVVADRYLGKRLNSPNDVVVRSNGEVYFTDPPYGLEGQDRDPEKELPFSGVYAARADRLTLLTDELTRPNGLAFSPDEKTLYVSNSDPRRAVIMAYPVNDDGSIGRGRVFADLTPFVSSSKGLPDGMAVDRRGNLFATGPGGVHVFTSTGERLGLIATGEPTANVALDDKGEHLYMTAGSHLCRIRLAPRAAGS